MIAALWGEKQIPKLIPRLGRAFDTGNGPAYRSCFTNPINIDFKWLAGQEEALVDVDGLTSRSATRSPHLLAHCDAIAGGKGRKAPTRNLAAAPSAWCTLAAVALVEDGAHFSAIYVEQGEADQFLDRQLKSAFLAAGRNELSYYFIVAFMIDHLHRHTTQHAGQCGIRS